MSEKQRKEQILSLLEQTYAGSSSALHFGSVFQLLIAVILSAQTNDNQVNRVTEQLFSRYPDAASMAKLSTDELEPLISSLGLYKNKTKNIIATANIIVNNFGGEVPHSKEELLTLPGVGGKTANVVLAVGFGIPALAVDTHVFRVSNRMALVKTTTPEQTEQALCSLIAKEKWADAHHWLIWHGRTICTAKKPKCASCPVKELCPSAVKALP